MHLGIFYRSATLYHPQRRAILHLKTQKRKIKDKNKSLDDTPPFFDLSCLKSRTIQIILLSTGVSSLGVNAPIYYLVNQIFNQVYKQHNILIFRRSRSWKKDSKKGPFYFWKVTLVSHGPLVAAYLVLLWYKRLTNVG